MIALTLTAPLLLAALSSAEPQPPRPEVDELARPRLAFAPVPSLLPAPKQESVLVASLTEEPPPESGAEPPAYSGLGRRKSGAVVLLSSLLALGASFAVMPLADAIDPHDSPNQGVAVLRLELVGYSAGAAIVGGYLLASSFWTSPEQKGGSVPAQGSE